MSKIAKNALARCRHLVLQVFHLLLVVLGIERPAGCSPMGRCQRKPKKMTNPKLNVGIVVVFNIPRCWAELKPDIKCCKLCWIQGLGMHINLAKVAIDVALLSLKRPELGSFISAAHDRGVNVRIITSSRMIWQYGPEVLKLWKDGVPVRYTCIGMDIHYNFAIVDSQKRILELNATQAKSKADSSLINRLFKRGKVPPEDSEKRIKPELSELQLYETFFDQWNTLQPIIPVQPEIRV